MTQTMLSGEEILPTYLLTIREGSAEALMNGIKPHEFRRRFDNYKGKARVFLYVTKPVGKIIGEIIFDTPIVSSKENLCSLLDNNKYDTAEKIKEYLSGCEIAYALPVLTSKRFNIPIDLEELKRENISFNPPMSYLKLDEKYPQLKAYLLNRLKPKI